MKYFVFGIFFLVANLSGAPTQLAFGDPSIADETPQETKLQKVQTEKYKKSTSHKPEIDSYYANDHLSKVREIEKNVCAETSSSATKTPSKLNEPNESATEAGVCPYCEGSNFPSESATINFQPTKAEIDNTKMKSKEDESRELKAYELNLCFMDQSNEGLPFQKLKLAIYQKQYDSTNNALDKIKEKIKAQEEIQLGLNNLDAANISPESRKLLVNCLSDEIQNKVVFAKKLENRLKVMEIDLEEENKKTPSIEHVSSNSRLKKRHQEFKASLETAQSEIAKLEDALSSAQNSSESSKPPSPDIIDTCKKRAQEDLQKSKLKLSGLNKQIEYYEEVIKKINVRIAQLENELQNNAANETAGSKMKEYENQTTNIFGGVKKNKGYRSCDLTIAEFYTLACYTSDGYRTLNSNLRRGEDSASKMKPYVDTLNLALEKLKPYKGIVHRYAILPPEILKLHKVGDTIQYPAYTSTSLSPTYSQNGSNHNFIIHSKTGRYVGSHSTHYSEAEVLFKADTKFKVLSREHKHGGVHFVLQEVD